MTNSQSQEREGKFLWGWGGVLAILLGIGVAVLCSPLIREIVKMTVRALEALGMTSDSAVMTLYWLQAIAIGVGVAIAVAGSDARMDRLREGLGDWVSLIREALVVAGVVSLWVTASVIWDLYVDVFNTYGNSTELPMVGLLVVFIAGSVIVRIVRKRRARRHPQAGAGK